MSLGSSPQLPFTPRKEFIKELPNQPNSFALLALAGANCIRLYSFSSSAVASLRRLLEQASHILAFREDSAQNLCEFALDGKPWANPKSIVTEKFLVDIIAVIYQCGYTYLSTIDYGREADDRLAITFSKPAPLPSHSRTASPLPPSISAAQDSTSSLNEKSQIKRVPFALSFSSVTVMRVISPPLHLTPAILQAVRGSWPRGVIGEKKVGDNSYEFKLKGYKWFQQDTFATDSLRHILSLLSSLDSHSFSLLTSVSLTNRSRVKDLWIFTGPPPEGGLHLIAEQYTEATPLKGSSEFIGPVHETQFSLGTQSQHGRAATEPSPAVQPAVVQHLRATTDSPQRQRFSPGQVLRKPAPRAQVPVSVLRDSNVPDASQPLRAHMPSTIDSGVENMTGIGASPTFFYATSPFEAAGHRSNGVTQMPIPIFPGPIVGSPAEPGQLPVSDRKTPPLFVSSSPPSLHKITQPPTHPLTVTSPESPALLGIGAFRDSSFSSNTEASHDIPIKWTGPPNDEFKVDQDRLRINPSRSSGPNFPGGWQPTPIAEKSEEDSQIFLSEQKKDNTTPVLELGSRFETPDVVQPDTSLRKSEAALVGIIQSTSSTPPVPRPEVNAQTPSGQGWVLVDVDNETPSHEGARSFKPTQLSESLSPSTNDTKSPAVEEVPPTAKAIVIIDAMESKDKKSKSTSQAKHNGEGSSGLRRFFSLNKKNSTKALDEAPNSIARPNLRDRLRLIGTPEASRREGKRRSID